jgi:uncharacterized membrane protein YgdD (TMEM256/DUF423 family)
MKPFIMIGALLMLVGVGAGAFGAHALADFLKNAAREGTYETAVRYQIYHALGLLAVAWLAHQFPSPWFNWAGWLMFAGVLIFSGSLYLLVFTGVRWLGAITPLGGAAFIAAWACVAIGAWRVLP